MGLSSGGDVRFDFAGSLQLARRLWAFADQADQLANDRTRWARDALGSWEGRFAIQFAERVDGEVADLRQFAGEMRAAAQAWATSWASAVNQQNDNNYASECVRRRNDRNLWEQFTDTVFGSSVELPDRPADLSAPVPPGFVETGSIVRY